MTPTGTLGPRTLKRPGALKMKPLGAFFGRLGPQNGVLGVTVGVQMGGFEGHWGAPQAKYLVFI